ncbi:MAG: GNAT family N-acetyltransferase [Chloroflexota bacterium]
MSHTGNSLDDAGDDPGDEAEDGTGDNMAHGLRNFRWEDLSALLDARLAVTGESAPEYDRALARTRIWLEMPGVDPEHNVFVSDAEEGLAGCATAKPELDIGRVVGELGVVPHYRGQGLGRVLLHRIVAHSTDIGAPAVHVSADWKDDGLKGLLGSEGFRHVRTFNRLRYRPAPAYLGADYRPLPPGVSLRPFELGQDEETLAEVQNDTFRGSWGFSPNTKEEIQAYISLRGSAPEDILFAVDEQSGEVMAYVWTALTRQNGETVGTIAMTGVCPNARGTGLGAAIVGVGVRRLRERGAGAVILEVDQENKPARRIYRDLGFRKVGEVHWHEKRLDI